jgi:hypothetical protein
MERFWGENRDRIPIPAGLKSRIEATTTAQMAATMVFVFAASCYPSYQAARSPIPGTKIGFFNTIISIRSLNAHLHLIQTLALRSYASGTVAALLVSLPYSLYVFRWLRAEDVITARDPFRALELGALLRTPAVLGAQTAGRALVRLLPSSG